MKLYFHYENIIIYCNFLPIFIIRKFWKFCFPSTPFPPTRGSWGSAGQCPVPLCARHSASAYLPPTCFAGSWFASAPTHLAKPRTFASLFPPLAALGFGSHSAKKKKMALRHPLSKNKTPTLQFLLYPSLFSNPCCSMESRVNLQHCNTNRLKEIPFCCATQFNRSNNPSVKRTVRGILAPLNSF